MEIEVPVPNLWHEDEWKVLWNDRMMRDAKALDSDDCIVSRRGSCRARTVTQARSGLTQPLAAALRYVTSDVDF